MARALGLIGRKCGMTRIIDGGKAIPVTVIDVSGNAVTQVKTSGLDGYNAIQLSFGEQKISRVNKPIKGHYEKAGVAPGIKIREFRLSEKEVSEYSLGDVISANKFEGISLVDVSGISKGKGFAGTIKRWNFKGQPMTHGNSLSHRVPGSTGQNQSPGKVFKGKKMPGQMGNANTTAKALSVVKIDNEKNLILVKGSVPGHAGSLVVVTVSDKNR